MKAGNLQMRGLVVAVFLCVVTAACLTFEPRRTGSEVTGLLEGKINPNVAPAASLVRLPRIGWARAQAIVVCRQRSREATGDGVVFQCPDDLQQIKGIGARTVEDVTDWLQFDSAAVGAE